MAYLLYSLGDEPLLDGAMVGKRNPFVTFLCLHCLQHVEGRRAKPGKERMFCSITCRQAYNNAPERNPAKRPEVRVKMSQALKGKQTSLGRKVSQETRDKISNALTGKPQPKLQGRPVPDATKAKIRAALVGRFVGPDNPNWRGGTSPRDWKTTRYKEFLRAVWARARGACEECGRRAQDGKLEVHHKVSWIAAPLFRYAPDNGILLCSPCHRKHDARPASHKTKRLLSRLSKKRSRNTKGQFIARHTSEAPQ